MTPNKTSRNRDKKLTTNIAFGVYYGIFAITAITGFAFALIHAGGSPKDACLKSGGVYTEGMANFFINYSSCTYSK
jgi:hypothetical protein